MKKKILADTILYITELVDMGGGEINLLSLIKKLDKKRFRPVVLSPKRGVLIDKLEGIGVRVIILKFGLARKILRLIPVVSLFTIFKVWRLLRTERVDLIHSNSFLGVVFSSLPAKLRKIPLVWTDHGWYSGLGIQGRFLDAFVDKIITVSESIKKYLLRNSCISADKVETVYLGTDLKEYNGARNSNAIRNEFGINPGQPLIGMIGRFQEIKGHRYFLEAVSIVRKVLPECRVLIVGARIFDLPEDQGYPGRINNWIQELGLKEAVICTGFRSDIPAILSDLDVLVLPSERESFGLILIESMAAGTPVVATRCGGPEEIIENNISGLLVSPRDAPALAESIIHLLGDKKKAEKIASEARKKVMSRFDISSQVERTESIYSERLISK